LRNAADGYNPYTLNNINFSIDHIKLGSCVLSDVRVEKKNILSAKLFPNPTSEIVNVGFTVENNAALSMTVTDLMGRTLISESVIGTEFANAIDVSKLKKGAYVVSFNADELTLKSELLLVK
jgi:hypothetical protein